MILSRDLINHHIQQHSTKSTNRIYLLPCSWRLIFLIHQTPFIYCWESAFLYCIVEKPTSRYPICWEAHQPLSICHSTAVSIATHQHPVWLRLDLSLCESVGIRRSLAIDEGLQNRIGLGWCLHWEDVTPLQSIGARP